jgi:heme exporter protein A
LIWILDEPLTALDSSGIQSVCQTIDAHLDRGGLVVLTSHQPITLERHAVVEFQIQGATCPT